MADVDKKALIDEGCNLLNEAIAEMRKAQELFKKCGIELCDIVDIVDISDIKSWRCVGNIQIFSGISKFEKIIGASGYFRNDCITGKPDISQKYLDYKNLVFLQLGKEKTGRQAEFYFR